MHSSEHVLYGPDINHTRSPLDKKLYRQIILKKNGLRAVLISDTLAMGQDRFYDDYSDSESEEKSHQSDGHDSTKENGDDDDDNDDDSADQDSDEEDDGLRKAAAALVVGAGSFHDPPCVEGMAHFLEHMLFMVRSGQRSIHLLFISVMGILLPHEIYLSRLTLNPNLSC